MANPIKKALDKAFKPILKPILDIYKAFLCIVRIARNIGKCWYWYILTVVKYILILIFIYIPLFITVLLISLVYKPKNAIKNLKKIVILVDKWTKWPADIRYKCFMCKKPKKQKFKFFKKLGKALRKLFAKKSWNFYKITLFIITTYLLSKLALFLFHYIYDKEFDIKNVFNHFSDILKKTDNNKAVNNEADNNHNNNNNEFDMNKANINALNII